MKKLHFRCHGFIMLLALAVGVPANAQQAGAVAATKHSLWKIEGKTNAIYLLGSVHLLKASDYPLPAPIETAFTSSQIAVFEADLSQMQLPETQMKMLGKATLPEGQTLQTQLTPETYAAFANHLKDAGLPLQIFERLQPFMAASTLEVLELQKLGVDPNLGLDQYLFDRASKDGKQIMPLETVDFQINLITDISKQEGEQLMKSTLTSIDQTKKEYGDMVNAWRTGDAAKLETLLNKAMEDLPAIFKRFVSDRSQNWVPKIEELLRGGKNAIVIVGAGHLVGKDGVVELLKKNGLKVTQL